MANGFGTLYVGASGLQMAQNALNTTANNISNVDTAGYVRQQVRFADKNYNLIKNVTNGTNIQQSGLGVSIGDVVHARDIFLDKSYRLENSRCEFYNALYESSSYIEDLYQELDGEEFKASVSELWSAVQELAKAPDDSTYQNLLIQKSELFIRRSQALYTDLQSYQQNLNIQIQDEVNRMNEIGTRLYELNVAIQKVEAGGVETAMTMRDERDNLIDELSGFAGVKVTEDASGFCFVEVEGVQFVDEGMCHQIGLRELKGTGFYEPYWSHLSNTDREDYVPVFRTDIDIDTEFNNDVGSVKAKLLTRGDGYGHYYDLDSLENYSRVEKSLVMENQAEIEKLLHGVVTAMNDILCPNIGLEQDVTLDDGTVLPAGTLVLDAENCNVGADKKLPPQELFVRSGVERYREVRGDDGKTYYVYNAESEYGTVDFNPTNLYSIGNIHINEAMTKQATLLPMWKQDGAVSYDVAQSLKDAWSSENGTLSPVDTEPVSFETFYDKMISKLGSVGNTYKAATETLTSTVASIENNRQQVTGVSNDEELTKMVKYQAAYNASSRFITVISEMTEMIVTGLI